MTSTRPALRPMAAGIVAALIGVFAGHFLSTTSTGMRSRVDAQRRDTGRPPADASMFAEPDLRQWLTYLASDELQGRQAYTEGIGLAGAYLARTLEGFGVEPLGDNGSYFQTVRVLGMRTRSRSSVTVTVNGESRTFKDGEGVTFPRNQGGPQTVSGPVEFVGHGISYAPLGHDDYASRRVAGTIVVYVGTKGPSSFTQTHNRLLNARGRTAIETFGAIATIGPTTPPPTSPAAPPPGAAPAGGTGTSADSAPARGTGAAANAAPAGGNGATADAAPTGRGRGAAAQRTDFQTAQRTDTPVPPQITAGDELLSFLFSASGRAYADVRAAADRQEVLPALSLGNVRVSITVDADYETVQTRLTRNVVGIVRGSDPALANTYVMLGAHYDHVGYQQFAPAASTGTDPLIASCTGQSRPTPREGDIIFNGADDDGSGTTALLAIARAFAKGPRPRRSVLFVWHTAEEGGLSGSRYMADHPVVPLDQVVAQLNIDMVGRNRCDDAAESDTVYLVGSDRISTDLHNWNEDANRSLPKPLTLNYELNDAADLESLYTRSDHYSYAAKGVPVIFFTTGLHRDYHYVTDEVDKIRFDKLSRIAELVYTTAWRAGSADRAPVRDRKGPRVGKGQTGRIGADR